MRKLFLLAGLSLAAATANAQYLFGTSVAVGVTRGFVRFNPSGNAQKVLLPSFEYYQPISTKDTAGKVMYLVVQNTGTAADSLITVKLATNGVTKHPLPKGQFGYPQYTAGKIVSLSAGGLMSYDLTTRAATVRDAMLKPTGVRSTAFDHSGGRYLFMKNGTSSTNGKDTLFVYNMGTKALTSHLVDCAGSSIEMCYSPKSNKVVFLGSQTGTANFGIYSYDLGTSTLTYETPLSTTGGTLTDCATFDEVGNRYFAVRQTNNGGTQFNVLEYNLNTKTLTNHNIGAPGIGYAQFFNNAPTATTTGIATSRATGDYLALYPNPASGTVSVRLALEGKSAVLTVTELSGKSVLQQAAIEGPDDIDVSRMPAGRYVVRVDYAGKSVSRLFEKL